MQLLLDPSLAARTVARWRRWDSRGGAGGLWTKARFFLRKCDFIFDPLRLPAPPTIDDSQLFALKVSLGAAATLLLLALAFAALCTRRGAALLAALRRATPTPASL